MKLASLEFFYHHFAEEQMNFLYTGEFSDEHTDGFIELNNQQYNALDAYKKSLRKAGFLIAECFQNIVRHNEEGSKDSYFHIKNNDGLFSIVSGNTVNNQIIPSLKGQLEQLNKLTSQELKEEYRRVLSEEGFSEKGGAGLGFIEMARRSKNKLSFTFSEIDAIKSYFYFRLHLELAEKEEFTINNDFNTSILLRNKMIRENLFFLYKGVVSIQTTIVILGIIEKTIQTVSQKVVFVKFMGLFEKISGLQLPGKSDNANMLLIGEDEEEYSISATCLLSNTEASRLDRMLKLFANYDEDALDRVYQRALKAGKSDEDFSLDFVELLKISSKFEFGVRSHSEGISLVSMVINFKKKPKSRFQRSLEEAQTKKKTTSSIPIQEQVN